MLRQFSTKRIVLTAAIDWLGALAALLLASWLRARLLEQAPYISAALASYEFLASWPLYPSFLDPQVFLLVAGIWPFFLVLLGAYDGSRNATLKAELFNVFLAVGVSSLTLASALFFTFRNTSRLVMVTFFILSLAVLWGVRIGLWAYRLKLHPPARLTRRQLLVVGAGPAGRATVEQLRQYAWADVNLVGYVDDDPEKIGQQFDGAQVLGGIDQVARIVATHHIQDAIVALPLRAHERLVEVCRILQEQGVRVHVIPDLFALSFPSATLEGFGGIPMFNLGQPGIYGWRRVSKRAFDMALSALGLVLISPVLLLLALAIRLESPGPVLYRQSRIGENGRPFTMLKFRSMVVNADPGLHQAHVARLIQDNISLDRAPAGGQASLKLADDPRVTRVGALIRKTSLDELPQLFNVLRGEMSLVGPRPPIAYEVALYQDWHKRRLAAPPGMTGLWQVRGRNRVSFDEMVRMDIDYIEHQSLWLDVKLLVQTPLAVVGGQGAG
jgi:exopolysaccharide biosynthesis polyprenyl glycosylphosphotransferase